MSVTETRVLPPAFIEAAGKTFLGDLSTAAGKFKSADLSKVFGPQFVAQMDPLQLEAVKQATAGIGSFQPFLTAAQQATGPQAYQAFMSPFQKDVIDTTLQEFDKQAQLREQQIKDQATVSGAFGGAREGIQRAEFQSQSDKNRAALQAQLLQQGFGQAQQLAGRQFQQQMGLATGQQGLQGRQISGLATLGANVQAQKQAELQAQQQLAQQRLQQPLTAAQAYGSGVTSLIAGYPGQDKQVFSPSPSGTQTALSTASTLAGIYGALR
jgi:hypothetical protein